MNQIISEKTRQKDTDDPGGGEVSPTTQVKQPQSKWSKDREIAPTEIPPQGTVTGKKPLSAATKKFNATDQL